MSTPSVSASSSGSTSPLSDASSTAGGATNKYYVQVNNVNYVITSSKKCNEQFWIAASEKVKIAIQLVLDKNKISQVSKLTLTADSFKAEYIDSTQTTHEIAYTQEQVESGEVEASFYQSLFNDTVYKGIKKDHKFTLREVFHRIEDEGPELKKPAYMSQKHSKTLTNKSTAPKTANAHAAPIEMAPKEENEGVKIARILSGLKKLNDTGPFNSEMKKQLGVDIRAKGDDESGPDYILALSQQHNRPIIILYAQGLLTSSLNALDNPDCVLLYANPDGTYQGYDKDSLLKSLIPNNPILPEKSSSDKRISHTCHIEVTNKGDCGPASLAEARAQKDNAAVVSKAWRSEARQKGQELRVAASRYMLENIDSIIADPTFEAQYAHAWSEIITEDHKLGSKYPNLSLNIVNKFCKDIEEGKPIEDSVKKFVVKLLANYQIQNENFVGRIFFQVISKVNIHEQIVLVMKNDAEKYLIQDVLQNDKDALLDPNKCVFLFKSGSHYQSLLRQSGDPLEDPVHMGTLCNKFNRSVELQRIKDTILKKGLPIQERMQGFTEIKYPNYKEAIKALLKGRFPGRRFESLSEDEQTIFFDSLTDDAIKIEEKNVRAANEGWTSIEDILKELTLKFKPGFLRSNSYKPKLLELKKKHPHTYLALKFYYNQAAASDDAFASFIRNNPVGNVNYVSTHIDVIRECSLIRNNGTELHVDSSKVFKKLCLMKDFNTETAIYTFTLLETYNKKDLENLKIILRIPSGSNREEITKALPLNRHQDLAATFRELKEARQGDRFMGILKRYPTPSARVLTDEYENLRRNSPKGFEKVEAVLTAKYPDFDPSNETDLQNQLLSSKDAIQNALEEAIKP